MSASFFFLVLFCFGFEGFFFCLNCCRLCSSFAIKIPKTKWPQEQSFPIVPVKDKIAEISVNVIHSLLLIKRTMLFRGN